MYVYFRVAAALHEVKAVKVKVRDHKGCSISTEQLISPCVSFCKWILKYWCVYVY